MRVHRNAKTTQKGRALIVQRVEVDGWSVAQTAAAFGVSARTVHKWRARHAAAGLAGLDDRASAPQRIHHRTAPRLVAAIAALRAQQRSGAAIARRLGLPRSTVGSVLRRLGLGRLRLPTVARPVVPRARRRLVRGPWGARRAGHDGQRLRVSLPRLSGDLCPARPAPSLHAPLHAAHEREGRALYPDAPPRMGLPPPVRDLAAADPCTAAVAALLQRPPAPHELAPSRAHDSASAGLAMNNLPGFDT